MPLVEGQILMEDATLVFKNFTGREDKFNQEGNRNFGLILDDELANALIDDGWAVKQFKDRGDGEIPQKYIKVSLKYRGRNGAPVRPPTVVLIGSKGRTQLSEEEVEFIDMIDIANVDLIVRPYKWEMNGNTGVKAYLQSIYVTVREDYLAQKYRDVPEVGSGEQQLALSSGSDDVWDAEVVDEDEVLALES